MKNHCWSFLFLLTTTLVLLTLPQRSIASSSHLSQCQNTFVTKSSSKNVNNAIGRSLSLLHNSLEKDLVELQHLDDGAENLPTAGAIQQPRLSRSSIASKNDRRCYSSILDIRGGSLTVEEKSEGFFVFVKLKNLVRSIVRIGDKRAPLFTSVFIKPIAKLFGIKLNDDDKIKKKRNKDGKGSNKKKGKSKKDKDKASSSSSMLGKTHLNKPLKKTSPNYRIQRELKEFLSAPPDNLKLKVGKNIRVWIITMTFPPKTIYEGEKYRLRIQFPNDYPTSPPSVFFLQPTPSHEHVYTNGDICLSLLGKDWRPTMTAQSIAMSILSILSGATRKSLPMDNVRHSGNKPGGKQDDWVYHDDNC